MAVRSSAPGTRSSSSESYCLAVVPPRRPAAPAPSGAAAPAPSRCGRQAGRQAGSPGLTVSNTLRANERFAPHNKQGGRRWRPPGLGWLAWLGWAVPCPGGAQPASGSCEGSERCGRAGPLLSPRPAAATTTNAHHHHSTQPSRPLSLQAPRPPCPPAPPRSWAAAGTPSGSAPARSSSAASWPAPAGRQRRSGAPWRRAGSLTR